MQHGFPAMPYRKSMSTYKTIYHTHDISHTNNNLHIITC